MPDIENGTIPSQEDLKGRASMESWTKAAALEEIIITGRGSFVVYFPTDTRETGTFHSDTHNGFRGIVGLPELPEEVSSDLTTVTCDNTDILFEGVDLHRQVHLDTGGNVAGILYFAGETADTWKQKHSMGSVAVQGANG